MRDHKSENSIEILDINKMLYIDDFFFMLGRSTLGHSSGEYLFLTKGNEVKNHFKLHTKTLALKKVVLKDAKLIISLGYDTIPENDDIETAINTEHNEYGGHNQRKVVKVWDYNRLIMNDYDDYMQAGLTGGYDPAPTSPRMIELEENSDSPPMDYLDVSSCGSYIGVVASRTEIVIHKAFPNFGISADKPIKTRSIKLELKRPSSQILSLHFYRDRITNINYMYIASSDMIYLLDTERKSSEKNELTLNEIEVIPG